MSDPKAYQGFEIETRELLGGTEENNILPHKGSFETEKIELVTRPVFYLPCPPLIFGCLRPPWLNDIKLLYIVNKYH